MSLDLEPQDASVQSVQRQTDAGAFAASPRTCAHPGCPFELPESWPANYCIEHQRLYEQLQWFEERRCEARGPDWECSDPYSTQRFGKLCQAHYQQISRGGSLKKVQKRRKSSEQFEGWIAILREHGYTVVPPGEEEK